MAAPRPRPATQPGLLDDEDPGKWDRVKQALWETNLNAPIRGIYSLMNADPHTLYTDEGAAGQQAVADSFDAAGGVTVGSMPIPKPSNSLTMGIKAYHGSPHSFDKFSMDKIGTGEGAQAYGHGLYFAENEGVAKGYRDDLSSGTVLNVRPQSDAEAEVLARIKNYADEYGGVPEKATVYRDILNDYDRAQEWIPAYEDMLIRAGGGSMYEVNIDADPNAFLDWDKPLSEQPEVQSRLATIGEASRSSTTKGVDKYISLENMLGAIDWPDNADAAVRAQYRKGAAARVSEKLKEAGIPGIKYLDAGSRGAGDGTRNYVVFDDSLVNIIKKYGLAGLLGGGAAANEMMSQPQEQY